MANTFLINYFFILSTAGFILLTFFGFCCFINVEALMLRSDHKNISGLACLVAAVVMIKFIVDVFGDSCISLL